ncbi:MAG: hypothetical protein A3I06_03770 [Candidatus Lindowbacteria bacterium RIFCSPLOWO2_02_FULL_62_12]|nr:MAG: hypothetical protein A3I06_03770 [Candidatus Lindowbacteria bacterium RIFCSPLOWO2_02_FULL_62_12]
MNSGFGGYRRDWILQNFLLILKKSRDLAHAAGLPYGCDVPFWFDSPDEFTNEKFIVEFGGQRKLVSDHLIDLVDNVGIMDYRTVAYGADGVIAHAGGELEYAAKAGKPIFVGLETFGLPDETQWSFRTDAQAGLPVLAAGTFLFARASGDSGAFYYVPEGGLDTFVAWTKTRRIDPAALRYWRLKEKIFVPSSKVTFAGMPADRLKLAMEQARFELSKIPSFAGFAIHYYETYRDLLSPVKR